VIAISVSSWRFGRKAGHGTSGGMRGQSTWQTGGNMARKKPETEITVPISFPKGLWTEAVQWAKRVNEPAEPLVPRALKSYLDDERRKAFLATNPIYE